MKMVTKSKLNPIIIESSVIKAVEQIDQQDLILLQVVYNIAHSETKRRPYKFYLISIFKNHHPPEEIKVHSLQDQMSMIVIYQLD